jgi:hypothetical protein
VEDLEDQQLEIECLGPEVPFGLGDVWEGDEGEDPGGFEAAEELQGDEEGEGKVDGEGGDNEKGGVEGG